MELQLNDPKTWLSGTISALVVILGWVWSRMVRQHDRYGSKIQLLEQNSVTREELERYMEANRQDRLLMHEENQEMLQRIHTRVDQLWERL